MKLSGVELSTSFNLKGAIYCGIGMYLLKILPTLYIKFLLVAAIIGHLHFFLIKESSDEHDKPTLEQVVQSYLESTSHNAINLQTVENIFKASSVEHAKFLKLFKHFHIDKELLVKGAVQITSDNLLSMNLRI